MYVYIYICILYIYVLYTYIHVCMYACIYIYIHIICCVLYIVYYVLLYIIYYIIYHQPQIIWVCLEMVLLPIHYAVWPVSSGKCTPCSDKTNYSRGRIRDGPSGTRDLGRIGERSKQIGV